MPHTHSTAPKVVVALCRQQSDYCDVSAGAPVQRTDALDDCVKHDSYDTTVAGRYLTRRALADCLWYVGNAFFGELFVKYSDGFIASATPRPPPAPGAGDRYTPGGTSTVSVQEPGYDQAWYDRIVADAGEKYHVPPEAELIDPRLSTDRLRFL